MQPLPPDDAIHLAWTRKIAVFWAIAWPASLGSAPPGTAALSRDIAPPKWGRPARVEPQIEVLRRAGSRVQRHRVSPHHEEPHAAVDERRKDLDQIAGEPHGGVAASRE